MTTMNEASRGVYRLGVLAQPPAAPQPKRSYKQDRKPVARDEALSAEATRAWLLMRDEGGFWSATELGLVMKPGAATGVAGRAGGRWLSALLKRNHVAANPLAIRVPAYGVTGRCVPIPGMSLEPGLPFPNESTEAA